MYIKALRMTRLQRETKGASAERYGTIIDTPFEYRVLPYPQSINNIQHGLQAVGRCAGAPDRSQLEGETGTVSTTVLLP